MARPQTPRSIRRGLTTGVFKPLSIRMRDLERNELTLDGLEALRLADVEGLYHVAAAERMGVSRATFGRILGEARRTVAETLVGEKALIIEGGAVLKNSRSGWPCPVHGRERHGRDCRCPSGR